MPAAYKTAGEHGKTERALYGYFPQGNNHTGVFIRFLRGYLRALTRESDNAKAKNNCTESAVMRGTLGRVFAADASLCRAVDFGAHLLRPLPVRARMCAQRRTKAGGSVEQRWQADTACKRRGDRRCRCQNFRKGGRTCQHPTKFSTSY